MPCHASQPVRTEWNYQMDNLNAWSFRGFSGICWTVHRRSRSSRLLFAFAGMAQDKNNMIYPHLIFQTPDSFFQPDSGQAGGYAHDPTGCCIFLPSSYVNLCCPLQVEDEEKWPCCLQASVSACYISRPRSRSCFSHLGWAGIWRGKHMRRHRAAGKEKERWADKRKMAMKACHSLLGGSPIDLDENVEDINRYFMDPFLCKGTYWQFRLPARLSLWLGFSFCGYVVWERFPFFPDAGDCMAWLSC